MQKLIRRSPCVLASSGRHSILPSASNNHHPPFSSLPLSTSSFHSLGFFNKTSIGVTTMSSAPKMTTFTSAAAASNPRSGLTTKVISVPSSKNGSALVKALNFSTSSCRICTCSAEGSTAGSGRAWIMLKDCKARRRKAWFGTLSGGDGIDTDSLSVGAAAADKGGSSSDESENVVESGKGESVQRRQRGGGGGGGVSLRGNPDLLTIPGVGPRNLRKLVEKGFDGVDQLKQFYKDKV